MADEWDKYASGPVATAPAPSSGDEWDKYAATPTMAQTVPAGTPGGALPSVPSRVPVPDALRQGDPNPGIVDNLKLGAAALTQPEATGTRPGTLGNAATAVHNFGAHAVPAAVAPFVHPLDTLQSAAEMTPPGQVVDAILGRQNPIERATQQFQDNPDKPQAVENLAGDVAGGIEGGRLATGALAKPAQAVINKVGDIRQAIKPSTSPAIVTPVEQNAASLARAIAPPQGVTPGFEQALAQQGSKIRDYATRTGNPLNTRWELAKAAAGHGQELNDFYDNNVLGPSADKPVSVEGTGYQGDAAGEGKATLGAIDKRLGKINDMLRPAYGKMSEGAQMTALEKSGLQDEAAALRDTLYKGLSQETGMAPEEIQALRQGYGQSYEIASQADAARRGQRTQPGSVPLTKEGVIQSALEHVVGGKDAIADRRVQSAFQQFEPAMSDIPQWRQNISSYRSNQAAQAAANQAAAQQEVLHGNQLDQEAQAASTRRGQQAAVARSQNTAQATNANQAAAQQEVLHAHDLLTGAQDASTQRSNQVQAARTWSKSQWKFGHPKGDLRAAESAARSAGHKVVD